MRFAWLETERLRLRPFEPRDVDVPVLLEVLRERRLGLADGVAGIEGEREHLLGDRVNEGGPFARVAHHDDRELAIGQREQIARARSTPAPSLGKKTSVS